MILENDDTREKLLAAALSQFADRGFYGASIAQIANEVGLTKQALLYHFKRKEDLYGEVLRRISVRLGTVVSDAVATTEDPVQQLERIMLSLHLAHRDFPHDTRLLVRELLDNRARAARAKDWYLRPFLDGIVSVLLRIPGFEGTPFPRAFSHIFQLIGALEYFAISEETLKRMYGEQEYQAIGEAYPDVLRGQIKRLIASAAS